MNPIALCEECKKRIWLGQDHVQTDTSDGQIIDLHGMCYVKRLNEQRRHDALAIHLFDIGAAAAYLEREMK